MYFMCVYYVNSALWCLRGWTCGFQASSLKIVHREKWKRSPEWECRGTPTQPLTHNQTPTKKEIQILWCHVGNLHIYSLSINGTHNTFTIDLLNIKYSQNGYHIFFFQACLPWQAETQTRFITQTHRHTHKYKSGNINLEQAAINKHKHKRGMNVNVKRLIIWSEIESTSGS